jgi:hypothetical protein
MMFLGSRLVGRNGLSTPDYSGITGDSEVISCRLFNKQIVR